MTNSMRVSLAGSIAWALIACASSSAHPDTATTSSSAGLRESLSLAVPATSMLNLGRHDLPPEEPAPVDPRVERDLDLAARAAEEQDARVSDAISAAIHAAIIRDPDLSLAARAVGIITTQGKVTLTGRVTSMSERLSIELKASLTTGVVSVDDKIRVVPLR